MMASVVTLNTKGCCLFCLKEEGESFERKSSSPNSNLRNLLRSLNVFPETRAVLQKLSKDGRNNNKLALKSELGNIQGTFCVGCGDALESFSVLLLKLESIQLEMDNILDGLHGRISGSYKDSDLIQNFSKRMTSDVESLRQLPLVDRLRKEIDKQSSIVRFAPQLKVKLSKLNTQTKLPSSITPPDEGLIKTKNKKEPESSSSELEDDDHYFESLSAYASPAPFSPSTSMTDINIIKAEDETGSESDALPSTTNQSDASFASKRSKSSSSAKNRTFKCLKCPKTYSERGALKRHYEIVHLHKRYRCELCLTLNKVYHSTSLYVLQVHQKREHGLEPTSGRNGEHYSVKNLTSKPLLNAPKPSKYSNMKSKTGRGYQTDNLKVRFPCNLCGKVCLSNFSLWSHQNSKNCKASTGTDLQSYVKNPETGKLKCPWSSCSFEHERNEEIRNHYRSKHLEEELLQMCEKCGSKFKRPGDLKRHSTTCNGVLWKPTRKIIRLADRKVVQLPQQESNGGECKSENLGPPTMISFGNIAARLFPAGGGGGGAPPSAAVVEPESLTKTSEHN